VSESPLLSVRELKTHYRSGGGLLSGRGQTVRAVDGVSFDIRRGETLGLVGESGCGKSTVAKSLVRLEEPTAGEIRLQSDAISGDVSAFGAGELKAFRREVQMIFQDPASAFDPRMTVGDSVAEPLAVHGFGDRTRRRRVVEDLLDRVGLSAEEYDRYPHEFSGGEKQRLALARALVLNPSLVIADEPVSALDVSTQADILGLIDRVQSEFGLAVLFISHDMGVVADVCDRVAVMYLGEIVEVGPTDRVFEAPNHPYTEALLSAVPSVGRGRDRPEIELSGSVPDPADPPSGCRFHTRCHRVIQPPDVDVDPAVWRRLLDLRRRIEAGEIDVESVRDRGDGSVEAGIRAAFDLPAPLPDPEGERALREGLEALSAGEDGRAADRLAAAFSTPCERSDPELGDCGGSEAACLRHDPAVPVSREWDPEGAGGTGR